MNISYRKAKSDELARVLDVYQHLHTHDEPLPAAAVLEQAWADIVRDPKMLCLVAEADAQFIASCILIIVPNLTRGARPYGLIENVVTHADYRRKGIGTALLQHALDLAWLRNCYKVMLMTGRKDDAVMRFYEGAGFKRGVKTGFIAYPGSWELVAGS